MEEIEENEFGSGIEENNETRIGVQKLIAMKKY